MNQLETAEQEFKLALEQPHAPELHLRFAKVYECSVNPAMHARQVQFYMEEKAGNYSETTGDQRCSLYVNSITKTLPHIYGKFMTSQGSQD